MVVYPNPITGNTLFLQGENIVPGSLIRIYDRVGALILEQLLDETGIVNIGMKATDDGHQFTSSKIVLLDCNSKQVHDLTSPSEMGMNPSASAEAGRIVYSTVEGKLFMLELNVTK